ncbi:cupin domain-containing protein [Ferrovibrio terrae]|uniref:cupin domain-containing protein n=1 Tax=Ferrovibrio terrae TaxID=2594003 RepID=UPI0031377F1F
MRSPRRIVTGHNAAGKSVVAIDTMMKPAIEKPELGVAFFEVWNTAGSPVSVDNGQDPTNRKLQIEPPRQGSIIRFVDFGPKRPDAPAMTRELAQAAFAMVGSAHASTWKPDSPHPMMHRTESIDYGIVVFGEITLVLDDGSETHLQAGDVVVQRGTDHAWENRSPTNPARMAFILLDGAFSPDVRKLIEKA